MSYPFLGNFIVIVSLDESFIGTLLIVGNLILIDLAFSSVELQAESSPAKQDNKNKIDKNIGIFTLNPLVYIHNSVTHHYATRPVV